MTITSFHDFLRVQAQYESEQATGTRQTDGATSGSGTTGGAFFADRNMNARVSAAKNRVPRQAGSTEDIGAKMRNARLATDQSSAENSRHSVLGGALDLIDRLHTNDLGKSVVRDRLMKLDAWKFRDATDAKEMLRGAVTSLIGEEGAARYMAGIDGDSPKAEVRGDAPPSKPRPQEVEKEARVLAGQPGNSRELVLSGALDLVPMLHANDLAKNVVGERLLALDSREFRNATDPKEMLRGAVVSLIGEEGAARYMAGLDGDAPKADMRGDTPLKLRSQDVEKEALVLVDQLEGAPPYTRTMLKNTLQNKSLALYPHDSPAGLLKSIMLESLPAKVVQQYLGRLDPDAAASNADAVPVAAKQSSSGNSRSSVLNGALDLVDALHTNDLGKSVVRDQLMKPDVRECRGATDAKEMLRGAVTSLIGEEGAARYMAGIDGRPAATSADDAAQASSYRQRRQLKQEALALVERIDEPEFYKAAIRKSFHDVALHDTALGLLESALRATLPERIVQEHLSKLRKDLDQG